MNGCDSLILLRARMNCDSRRRGRADTGHCQEKKGGQGLKRTKKKFEASSDFTFECDDSWSILWRLERLLLSRSSKSETFAEALES